MRAPDRIVRGRIATLAGASGFGWVQAIAITDGLVVAAGTADEIDALAGARTRRLDLPSGTAALPGMIDAHVHLADAALLARQVDLEPATTIDEGLALVASAAAADPQWSQWIEGGGWDPARWGGWPTADQLERVAPGRLVAIWSHDRHALWVSHTALRRVGIDRESLDPAGGSIRRNAAGDPSGVLQESAVGSIDTHLALDLESAIVEYASGLVRMGVVGVHDPGPLLATRGLVAIAASVALADRDALPIRVQVSVRAAALEHAIAQGWRTGGSLVPDPGARVRMGWLKLFADGALGSRTALLREPYEGGDDDHGMAVTGREELAELAARSSSAGIVPQIHAIGDAALGVALDVLEPLAPRQGPMARVEHVQLAAAHDLPRFTAARIGASIQPIHLRTDRNKAHGAWGRERSERDAYRFRSLLDAGAVVALGTDAPVEPVDPWPGIELAVTRHAQSWGSGPAFGNQEAVSLEAALRAATVGPSLIAGDALGGRLVVGSRADLIVIPAAALDDPVEPGGMLGRLRPSLVLIDGQVAHEN